VTRRPSRRGRRESHGGRRRAELSMVEHVLAIGELRPGREVNKV
jgi:hypothetical protein